MKSLLRPFTFLACSASLLFALNPSSEGFLDAFKAAMKAGDKDQMQSIVKGSQDEAAVAVIAICEAIAEQPSEELEETISALQVAWRGAFDTKFPHKQYEYFSLMRPEIRGSRAELMTKYVGERTKYETAMAEESYRELPGIGFELEHYAKSFVEIGDLYHASEAWLMHAWSFEEEFLGEDANLNAAFAGLEQGLALRKEIGLIDSKYEKANERFETLKNAGVGSGEFSGSLAGKARREAAEAAAVTVPLEFEVVKNIEGKKRPYYCADVVFQAWPGISLQREGTKQPFPYVEDSPMLMRTGAASASVDLDGDGAGDVDVPLTGSIVPVEMTLGTGDEARPWAFLAAIGQQRDRYQGFDFNLEATLDQLTIYIAPAASIVGEVLGQPIRVLDDNMDGIYGGKVNYWANIGITSESSGQADVDSVFVGKEKSARPWSPLMKLGEDWFHMEIEGTALTATPESQVETGTLKLDFKGPKPDYVVVTGQTKWGDCYFDLVPGGKKGTEVPAGSYYLISGRVSKGKREQVMKALMLPPSKPKGYNLKAGETLTIQLGAPFGFQFDVSDGSANATVNGQSVAVTGRGGESYQRLWNCVVTPEASMRKAGSKKAYVSEQMKTATHQDDLITHGYEGAWFPWDIELPKKKEGEEIEVQLFQKKHKLFGKIESEWRN